MKLLRAQWRICRGILRSRSTSLSRLQKYRGPRCRSRRILRKRVSLARMLESKSELGFAKRIPISAWSSSVSSHAELIERQTSEIGPTFTRTFG